MMTVEQVAKILNVTPKTVYRLVNSREIPYVKLGYRILRFKQEDINKYINQHTIKAIK